MGKEKQKVICGGEVKREKEKSAPLIPYINIERWKEKIRGKCGKGKKIYQEKYLNQK